MDLADILGIRQSSISDAKRRGEIPASWLLTLLKNYRVNPEWIITGNGPQYLAGESGQPVGEVRINWHTLGAEIENILARSHTEIVGAMKDATQAWELP